MPSSSLRSLSPLRFLFFLSGRVYAIPRSIGLLSDSRVQAAVQECYDQANSTNPVGFDFGQCPALVGCVLSTLPPDVSAGMQSGTNIASLVPTILALIGAAPLDLVQLAFVSPLRAIATCVFGVGLPVGLFRQFQTHLPHLADKKPDEPTSREWIIPVPKPNKSGAFRLLKTILIDATIVALASVMVWRNVALGLQTVVTWRCEYSWLLLCWPVACVGWLLIALALLYALTKKIEIRYSEDPPNAYPPRNQLDLVLLPYRTPRPRHPAHDRVPLQDMDRTVSSQSTTSRINKGVVNASLALTPASMPQVHFPGVSGPVFYVNIIMRYGDSWRWFESTIEALAVGVYLYATFVLTSSLFLSGEQAMLYATVMILSLSAIRILEGYATADLANNPSACSMSALRPSLLKDGFVIIPSLLPRTSLPALRTAAARSTSLARSSQWPHIRTLPKHYFADDVVRVVGELLDCGEEELVMELYNLLVGPDRDFELRWHRDDVPATATAEKEMEALGRGWSGSGQGHAQWNLALFDDESLVVVPGSHCRVRTEAERDAGPYEVLEGQVVVKLEAGDAVFYDNNILHRGVYEAGRERMTLHGSMGRSGGQKRARNVLQHGIGEWVGRCDFGNLDGSIGKRAEGMRARLMEFGRGRTAEKVGYSHAD
ncbi:hypothetical protein MMC30_006548 [Trapelia coarctata]|nr:hypothetical protein [Trapelia coarctata]